MCGAAFTIYGLRKPDWVKAPEDKNATLNPAENGKPLNP